MADPAKLAEIEKAVKSNKIMLFMKGTPDQPLCGFSAAAVATLRKLNMPFATADVLADEGLRQNVKEYSDWPTYPQLFIKGELVGGNDILQQLYAAGDLGTTASVVAGDLVGSISDVLSDLDYTGA